MTVSQRMLNTSAISAASALVLGVGLVGMVGYAGAATPAEGTLSSTSTAVEWTGEPLAPTNPSQLFLGTAVCDPAPAQVACDDFGLHVGTVAAGDTVLIQVAGVGGGDYDAYVLDQDGSIIASGEEAGAESITIPAVAGDYTVRVMAFEQVADSFAASATLVSGGPSASPTSTPTPAPTDGRPGFTVYGAPEGLNDSHNAGEPSIGNSFVTGSTMYQSSLSTYKVGFDDTVTPARAAWSDVSANGGNGCPQGSTLSLDPILFTDHETGRTFESQLTGVDSLTCWTDDDGATWNPSQGGGIPSGVDHQTIGGGPYSAGDPLGASLPVTDYAHTLYYCSQDIATAFCASSHDGGTTFGPGVPTYDLTRCGGLHGHVKVAPDGTAYLPNKDCDGMAALAVSTDGGTTWTVRTIPGSTASDADPSVSIARDGTVYVGYVGADGKPAAAVSHDRGATWTTPQVLGGDFDINNAVFPAAVAGDDARAAIAFIGTPTAGDYQATGVFPGVWHLYVSTTYDGGATWVTSDATPDDPVQRGSICTGGTTCGDDRNLLDFIDATTDDHGRVLVGFADGCTGPCVSDPAGNNHDAYASIARQASGRTLFAKYDGPVAPATGGSSTATATATATPTSTATATATPTETATPTSTAAPATTPTPSSDLTVGLLSVARRGGDLMARVRMSNSGTTDLSGVETWVRDRGQAVGRLSLDLDAGESAERWIRWDLDHPHRRHVVRAVIDPRNLVSESDETDNRDRWAIRP